jgi:sulfite reductase beta subunit-like hemoprotein
MPTIEEIKRHSDQLRGYIALTLENPEVDGFYESDQALIKFHGFYQQKNREKNSDGSAAGNSFMVRGRIPGGRVTAEQYLAWDDLADLYGGGSLRLTTRQSVQLHGIVKDDLRPVLKAIHDMNFTTNGACGDVVRNVTQAVNPKGLADLALLDQPADLLSEHFQFKSSAWTEIWLGEKRLPVPGDEQEPIYGKTYLPRKFKFALTIEGDNGIDLYTNDMGLVATIRNGVLEGYFVFAGGGMGMTHNKPETYPRIADLVGWIPADKLIATAEAVVGVHRDFGDRTNRKHARLKYVIQEQGLAWFRSEVEKRQGFSFTEKPLPPWNTPSYLGWHERVDGTWALGVHILSGRIIDSAQTKLKTALRNVVRNFKPSVQFTADQDLILLGISPNNKNAVELLLHESGYAWQSESKLHDRALACVSLPTCPLALAEAERALPELLHAIDAKLEQYGLKSRAPLIRMTGCPNGCARPYSAEIGIVGQLPNKYAIFLGGSPNGDRLAHLWVQKIPSEAIADTLDPLFALWKNTGSENESFGDFIQRMGTDQLAALK